MEKKRKEKAPTTPPCKAPRACLRAAHHVGKEPKPGGMAVGVVGGKVEKANCAAVPSADAKAHLQFDRASRYRHVFDASSPCCIGDVASCGSSAHRRACDCEHPCLGISNSANRGAGVEPRAAAVHACFSADSCWGVIPVGTRGVPMGASLGAREGRLRLARDVPVERLCAHLKLKRRIAPRSSTTPLRMSWLLFSRRDIQSAINILIPHVAPSPTREQNEAPRHMGRHRLPPLIESDVALRHLQRLGQLCLRQAETRSNGFDGVHCQNRSKTTFSL